MTGFGLADGGMQPRQGQLVNVGEGGGDEMIVPLEPKWKDARTNVLSDVEREAIEKWRANRKLE